MLSHRSAALARTAEARHPPRPAGCTGWRGWSTSLRRAGGPARVQQRKRGGVKAGGGHACALLVVRNGQFGARATRARSCRGPANKCGGVKVEGAARVRPAVSTGRPRRMPSQMARPSPPSPHRHTFS
eukprot:364842-Chlamydomonas_euryale.AAC.6